MEIFLLQKLKEQHFARNLWSKIKGKLGKQAVAHFSCLSLLTLSDSSLKFFAGLAASSVE